MVVACRFFQNYPITSQREVVRSIEISGCLSVCLSVCLSALHCRLRRTETRPQATGNMLGKFDEVLTCSF